MMEFNWKMVSFWLGLAILFSVIIAMVFSAGCVTAAKNTYTEIRKTPTPTPTPLPTPTPSPTPSPKMTPVSIPTIEPHPVNLFFPGERWEGQWYQWKRQNVSGLKDLHAGIIVYRHGWLNSYHWYNLALGNYMVQKPGKGMRYFVVWIHQENLGKNGTGFFPLYEDAFRVQIGDKLYSPDTVHNPVCRIQELDHKYDFYNIVTAPPFGYFIRQIGKNPETGGYVAERLGEVQYGQGNSVDGYVLFEVSEKTMTEDVILLGNFGTFGSAWWKFTE